MEYGSMSIQRLQSGRWLNWGIRFFLTAALTASQTAGGYAPFALGCIAAAGPGGRRGSGAAGRRDGGAAVSGLSAGPGFAAVGILILTAATAFRDTAFLQKPWCCRCWRRDGPGSGRYLCAAILRPAEPRRPLCRSIGPDRRFRPLLHPGCSSRRRTGWPRRGCCF